MMKIHCAESGYFIEIDGVVSEAHRYGYSCIVKGPSGTLYGAQVDEEPEPGTKAQLYKLTPVDSLTECDLDDEGIEYAELPDEEAGDEIEVEDETGEEEEEAEEEEDDEDDDGK